MFFQNELNGASNYQDYLFATGFTSEQNAGTAWPDEEDYWDVDSDWDDEDEDDDWDDDYEDDDDWDDEDEVW